MEEKIYKKIKPIKEFHDCYKDSLPRGRYREIGEKARTTSCLVLILSGSGFYHTPTHDFTANAGEILFISEGEHYTILNAKANLLKSKISNRTKICFPNFLSPI